MSYLYHKNETIQYMYFISLIKKIYIYIYIYTKPVKMSSINISQEWSFKAFLTAGNVHWSTFDFKTTQNWPYTVYRVFFGQC